MQQKNKFVTIRGPHPGALKNNNKCIQNYQKQDH